MRKHWEIILLVLTIAVASALAGDSPVPLEERLGVISGRQHEARVRLNSELKAPTPEARKAAVDRYLAETSKNTEEALQLAGANPTSPATVEILKFVILAAGRGPGDQAYRAMELLRGHERDAGMGEVCGRIFHYGHFPVAEALIRNVLEGHTNRLDRGQACHQLAMYKLLQVRNGATNSRPAGTA